MQRSNYGWTCAMKLLGISCRSCSLLYRTFYCNKKRVRMVVRSTSLFSVYCDVLCTHEDNGDLAPCTISESLLTFCRLLFSTRKESVSVELSTSGKLLSSRPIFSPTFFVLKCLNIIRTIESNFSALLFCDGLWVSNHEAGMTFSIYDRLRKATEPLEK